MKCRQLFSSNFDMLAADGNQYILESIHYMEEKPLKIVPNLRKRKPKFLIRKCAINKITPKKSKKRKTGTLIGKNMEKEWETGYIEENSEQENLKESTNDPLFTPEMVVKCEVNEEKFEPAEESDNFFNSNYDDDKDFGAEDDEKQGRHKMKGKKKFYKRAAERAADDDDELDDDDDEPLIRLREKSVRKTSKKTKTPRLKDCQETCKHRCTTKFERQQRLGIYHFYRHLNQEDKINFLRAHVRKPVVKYLQANSMRCCYFLKIYTLADAKTIIEQSKEIATTAATTANNSFSPDDEELTKVCRTFFTGTLKISDQEIKEAVKDFELVPERIKVPAVKATQKVDLNKLPKMQYLDPETGDLTDTKPKTSNKRRKNNEPPAKRLPKPVKCAISCKFKCHEKFSEEERKQICNVFWSLDYQRRKDFVLARIEIRDVKRRLNPEYRKTSGPTRSYQTQYYLRTGPKTDNVRVCKHFMENTLNVHKCFIENAIEFSDKTTGAYTGFDRRVRNNKIATDRLQAVLNHIDSYPFWLPNKKSKTKYLHHSLTIRKMYEAYKEQYLAQNMDIVSVNFYYKIFHKDFQILFLANPHSEKGRGYFKSNPNISQYTGEEPGGCWFDSKGPVLDSRLINMAVAADDSNKSKITHFPKEWDTFCSGSEEALALNLVQNPLKAVVDQDSISSAATCGVLSNDSCGLFPAADSMQILE